MIPAYNPNIFQRIYNDVIEIKKELENCEVKQTGHEWIDIDELKSGRALCTPEPQNPNQIDNSKIGYI